MDGLNFTEGTVLLAENNSEYIVGKSIGDETIVYRISKDIVGLVFNNP